MADTIKLTQYSHGAGCGCKISPKVLDSILSSVSQQQIFPGLLVGNATRDDAAVFDIGGGRAIISTTDFFMPIVDDPQQFGIIASVNAISDVYAMGGTPVMAIAILGWPVNKVESRYAGAVLEGARQACATANIPLAGGHSIDSPEPIFGLAVTGVIDVKNLKTNAGATVGCSLFLTKNIGVGILSTAQKKQILKAEHAQIAPQSMMQLNNFGEVLGRCDFVEAMTDVTGFGLLGHLTELCDACGVSAEIFFNKVPVFDNEILDYYLEQACIPGGTNRNFDSYGERIDGLDNYKKNILCDPQTSGGLLVAVTPGFEDAFIHVATENGLHLAPFGKLIPRRAHAVYVR